MDADKFFEEYNRMCKTYISHSCAGCGIPNRMRDRVSCRDYIFKRSADAVEIVEKWSREHPRKTRQNEFLRLHPDARVVQGTLVINPCQIELSRLNTEECHAYMDNEAGCLACREEYWNAEVSDNAD